MKQFRHRVTLEETITVEELDQIDQEVDRIIEEAVRFADASPAPDLAQLYEDVYVDYPKELLKRGVNMEV